MFSPPGGLPFLPLAVSTRLCLSCDVRNGSLHPQLGILSVQELNVRGHRCFLRLAQTLIEHALELKLGDSLLLLNLCSHLKQAIAGSDLQLARRVAAANDD